MTPRQSNKPSIYGIGLVALDVVVSANASLPVQSWTGGTCANVLTILSFLGWNAYPVARLNGDAASLQVKNDFRQWGVKLDYAECTPTSATPIITEIIRHDKNGVPKHRFDWTCPHCSKRLPGFRPVTARSVEQIILKLNAPKVFFMDRLSRASLTLAAWAADQGAIVVFEPSANPDGRLLVEALHIAHIIKYADQRATTFNDTELPDNEVQLEIHTSGEDGLRFRSRLPKARTKDWVHLPALRAPVLSDTCGAGDWCTAGLVSKIGEDGFAGLQHLKRTELVEAFQFGQALAAWTCGFESARGGMYCMDEKSYDKQIELILEGVTAETRTLVPLKKVSPQTFIACSACPPT